MEYCVKNLECSSNSWTEIGLMRVYLTLGGCSMLISGLVLWRLTCFWEAEPGRNQGTGAQDRRLCFPPCCLSSFSASCLWVLRSCPLPGLSSMWFLLWDWISLAKSSKTICLNRAVLWKCGCQIFLCVAEMSKVTETDYVSACSYVSIMLNKLLQLCSMFEIQVQ